MWYVDVIVDISLEKLDKTFQYILRDDQLGIIDVGSNVYVPFGSRTIKGYVVGISDEAKIDPSLLKEVTGLVDNSVAIESKLIKIAYWMKHNYGSTINQALKTVLPVKETIKEKEVRFISLTKEYTEDDEKLITLFKECERKHYVAKLRLLGAFMEQKEDSIEESLISTKLNVSKATINSLEKQGVIEIFSSTEYRNPIKHDYSKNDKPELNSEQRFVASGIIDDYKAGKRDTYLIKGVTGSGKTEVYMEVIEHVLSEGKQVIMLIPEIALTFQTVMRFYKRFGDVVSILNSRMSKGERYDQYLRAKNNEIKIIIGPRSALFTPFDNLGLIVIDEEHESAYKSEISPKYHARETAIEIARMQGASVILGSATPSIDAFYKAKSGEYRYYELKHRAKAATLPNCSIVDLREELKKGNKSIFSVKLQELIEDRLKRKEQIMLFLNRRGYVGFINCRSCGYVVKCPHCDVALTSHNNGRLVCHYCGYTEPDKKLCPSCGSKYIGGFKSGTQKIEEMVKERFPQARVLRMDLDTTKGKDGHEKILEAFSDGEADILVGTQMIVKGHDFPKVTLVGILLADMSLFSADYRAKERTFELVTQAAGRAGRGEIPGDVIIQTYVPDDFCIQTAGNQDYDEFYEQEIMFRSLSDYPPVSNLCVVKASSPKEELPLGALEKIKAFVASDDVNELTIIGPSKANIFKMKDVFYYLLYLKHPSYARLTDIKDNIEKYIDEHPEIFKNVSVQFDFNP